MSPSSSLTPPPASARPWGEPRSVEGSADREALRRAAPQHRHAPRPRLASRWRALWPASIVLVAVLAHAINMFGFPYYESDEGTYMSQAWAVARQARLSPYTYWYDHAPLGWIQIAAWTTLTGGFYTFGTAVDSGRLLMLVLQAASTLLVYGIALRISRSILAATVAATTFALSAYGIYYHRRVLLDNIAAFWMLLSLRLLVSARLSRRSICLSAAALGISVLSKEVTIFLAPALAYLVFSRTRGARPRLATSIWIATLGLVVSAYPLMALARGELFSVGAVAGGIFERVSLLQTLLYQVGRGKDGGVFDADSRFWQLAARWAREEPLLVVGGTLAALLSVLTIRRSPAAGIVGLAVLSFWAFLGRGGEILPFYLVPLLPLLALSVGLLVERLAAGAADRLARGRAAARLVGGRVAAPLVGGGVRLLLASLCLALVSPGYSSPSLGLHGNRWTLWSNDQARSQQSAIEWIRRYVPSESRLVIDHAMWTDLRDPPGGARSYPHAHSHWKVERDPQIRTGVFADSWRNVDYVIATPQVRQDARDAGLPLVAEALERSTPVATFDAGGWPIEVRLVGTLHTWPVSSDFVLRRGWDSYIARFLEGGRIADRPSRETTSEGQSYALLRAVYTDDRKTFDEVWAWTRQNLQVRGDGLLAWRWGAGPGVLDRNAATDADQDTALALLFASRRWGSPEYLRDARAILGGIWEQETTVVAGRRLVVGGNWARGGLGNRVVVNPSYLAPYAYRVFAEADPDHPWAELVDSSYELLGRVRATPGLGGPAGLVPNWLMLDRATGELAPADRDLLGPHAREFSFDASRLPWRLTLDWLWFKDDRARQALEGLSLPRREIVRHGRLLASYRADGTPAAEYEAVSIYGATIGSLLLDADRDLASRVFAEKIAGRYADGPEGAFWGDPNNYYDQNWAWFATALMHGGMANLWAGQAVVDWAPVWSR